MPEPKLPPLNEQQVDAILAECLSKKLIEADVDGRLPDDPEARRKMALTMVAQAQLMFDAGSRSDEVATVLFIAECDMNPPLLNGGIDVADGITSLADENLINVERTLAATGESTAELEQARAEILRRGLAPTWDTSSNGSSNGAPDLERAELEGKLTFAILRKHNIDPSEVPGMSTETLRALLGEEPIAQQAAPPPPPPPPAPDPTPVIPAQPPIRPSDPENTIETTRMIIPERRAPEPAAEAPAAPTRLGRLSPAEREKLEEQVTGPMLRAYGIKSRADVPDLGDHELQFMIDHPDARALPEELEAARAKDRELAGEADQAEPPEAEAAYVEETQEEAVTPDQMRDIAATLNLPEDLAQTVDATASEELPAEPVEPAAQPEPTSSTLPEQAAPPQEPTLIAPIAPVGQRRVFESIVEKEHLPLPPEINEDPPELPYDMSKLSRDEIYSLHSRFHACESRANYLIALDEDELHDLEALRKAREVEVAAVLPATIDGKRTTDAQRSAKIAADEQVRACVAQEHELEKHVRKLKTLRDFYHSTVERCSRQLTRFSEEYGGAA
jgi:hypothetical protein